MATAVLDTCSLPPGFAGERALLPLVGADTAVPLVRGGSVCYADLDTAASTRALAVVADRVAEVLRSTPAATVAPATSRRSPPRCTSRPAAP